MADQWDQFWRQGFITTFGGAMESNYIGELRQLWESLFATMKPGSQVLDLATGNGALACIAVETFRDKGIDARVVAADKAVIPAQISAPRPILALRECVSFHSNMPCEQLAFADASFDLVTSQYGIEYSDWQYSLPEVYRVLKPGMSAHFVCHTTDSSLLENSRREIGIYKSALQQYQIFDAAMEFCKNFSHSAPKQAADRSQELNRVINGFREVHGGDELGSILIADISNHLKQLKTAPAQKITDELEGRKSEYDSALRRLMDMESAALAETDFDIIKDLAYKAGFSSFEEQQIFQQGKKLGTHLHLTR
ncbi:class I SAM-dependent methyltransferase [Microbulbifer sp. M83]|uniref:class I SAM-dependent methyltransferase n=2 Tax=Microbulbifer TaxID=48073 RepID=UPI002FE0BCEC